MQQKLPMKHCAGALGKVDLDGAGHAMEDLMRTMQSRLEGHVQEPEHLSLTYQASGKPFRKVA